MNCMPQKWLCMIQSNFISLICIFATLFSSSGCTSAKENATDKKPSQETEVPEEEQKPGDNTPSDPQPEVHELYLRDLVLESTILDMDIRYSVLLPRDYYEKTDQRYAVVYMLHGYGDNQNSWNGEWLHARERITALEDAGLEKMIYVYPMGFQSYYVNRYDGSFNYMDMFVQEFVPLIDSSFRTIADKQHRSITGYSMGGFGAYVLAAKHPEVFMCSAPLSMSFRTDKQYMTESASGWNSQWGTNFGGKGEKGEGRLTDYYKAHCPYYVFNDENRQALESVKWYFTCGDDEEQLLIANDSLHVILRDRNFAHEFRVDNGAHTSTYWTNALNEVLSWFSFYMSGGEKWPGRNIKEPNVPEISFDANGAYKSASFNNNGTLVLVAFHQMDRSDQVLAELSRVSGNYALLPCDLDVRSLSEWKEYWSSQYECAKTHIVALGGAGAAAMDLQDQVKQIVFYDAALGEDVSPVKSCKYIILNTDTGVNYRDMGALYTACKRSDCSFEYRVAKGTDDPFKDMLRIIETYKSLFNF